MAPTDSPARTPVEVLHLVHWPRSGITSLLKNLVTKADTQAYRHRVAFLIGEPGEMRWFADHGCPAQDLGYSHSPPAALARLRAAVRGLPGGVVHSHSFQPGVWGRLWYDPRRTGFLSTIHSSYPYFLERSLGDRVKSRLEQASLARAGHPVVAVSDAVQRHLLAHTRLDPQRIHLIRNGISTDVEFIPGAVAPQVRAAIGLADGERYAVAVARLSREKGIDVLLEAWPRVAAARPELRLVVVGDGAESAALAARAAALGLGGRVFFAGFQAEVFPWLAGAAVFVNPSRFEGLPMGVLEAQLAGVPLVATAVGGVPEVVADGVSGLLVEPQDPAALGAAILRLLAEPERAHAMAAEGRRQVLAGYDIRGTVARYEELYRVLAGGSRAARPAERRG